MKPRTKVSRLRIARRHCVRRRRHAAPGRRFPAPCSAARRWRRSRPLPGRRIAAGSRSHFHHQPASVATHLLVAAGGQMDALAARERREAVAQAAGKFGFTQRRGERSSVRVKTSAGWFGAVAQAWSQASMVSSTPSAGTASLRTSRRSSIQAVLRKVAPGNAEPARCGSGAGGHPASRSSRCDRPCWSLLITSKVEGWKARGGTPRLRRGRRRAGPGAGLRRAGRPAASPVRVR